MKIFYFLLSIILLTTTQAKSQAREPVPEPEVKIVKFYPNPAISYITFEAIEKSAIKAYSLQIFNFLGRKVFEASINSETKVDLTTFVRGIYIFQLKDQSGRISDSGKFQVNK
ncbi:MAG TPA: T9SS type A sorting domain-containing protein [Puia sp.]|nr:T9SS type A sorting domain-containing protein [Puia sp.]